MNHERLASFTRRNLTPSKRTGDIGDAAKCEITQRQVPHVGVTKIHSIANVAHQQVGGRHEGQKIERGFVDSAQIILSTRLF